MLTSIRFRLSASYVILTLLTAAAIGALTVGLVSRQLRTEEESSLRTQALLIAEQAFQYFIPVPQRDALRELALTSSVLGGVRVRILDPQRAPLADSRAEYAALRVLLLTDGRGQLRGSTFDNDPVPAGPGAAAMPVLARQPTAGTLSSGLTPPPGTPPRKAGAATAGTITCVVAVGGAAAPQGFIEITRDSAALTASEATRTAVVFAAIGAVLVAAAVGVFMGQGMTMSLQALSLAARDMGSGNLGARVRVRGRDEIARLSDSLNRMASQLEASFSALSQERDTLRRFVADASHELRTPLTALITFNELLRNAASSDPKAREEFLAESHRQLERLEWITRSLLILSRLEAGLVEPALETCDAGELVDVVSRFWQATAEKSGLTVRVEPTAPGLVVRCDRSRLEIALANLLSNAVKFTPAGGTITVGVERRDRCVRFWVSDTGPGIPESERERVFDRFYRGVNAKGAGSGLGLAIVKSVAVLHGGSVSVSSQPGQGCLFQLDIPA